MKKLILILLLLLSFSLAGCDELINIDDGGNNPDPLPMIEFVVTLENQSEEYVFSIHLDEHDNIKAMLAEYGYPKVYEDKELTKLIDSEFTSEVDITLYVDPDAKLTVGLLLTKEHDMFLSRYLYPLLDEQLELHNFDVVKKFAEHDADVQVRQVDDLIDSGADVIIANLVYGGKGNEIAQKAHDANIPIVFFMTNYFEPTVDFEVYTFDINFYDAGKTQAELVINHFNEGVIEDVNNDGEINYLLIEGDPSNVDQSDRTLGFVETLQGSSVFGEELDRKYGNWYVSEAQRITEDWISDSSIINNVDVIICNNDGMAQGVHIALDAEGMSIPVYGIDGTYGVDLINEGAITGSTRIDFDTFAEELVKVTSNILLGNDVELNTSLTVVKSDNHTSIRIPFLKVDQENINEILN